MWFDVQAKVIVKTTALKPINHLSLKSGITCNKYLVKIPSYEYKNEYPVTSATPE